jgi:hypothetical protein
MSKIFFLLFSEIWDLAEEDSRDVMKEVKMSKKKFE